MYFVLTAYHSSNHHKNSRVWKGFMIFLKAHFIGEFECHLIRYVACKMVHNPFCPSAIKQTAATVGQLNRRSLHFKANSRRLSMTHDSMSIADRDRTPFFISFRFRCIQ